MKLSATFKLPRIDFSKANSKLDEFLKEAIAQATFTYLAAVSELIPVWSGASRATLMPLASKIGFDLSIVPVHSPDRINLGLTNAIGEIAAPVGGVTSFTYSTTLQYLIFNEFNNANTVGFHLLNPGPYRFQDVGHDALNRFSADLVFPSLDKLVTTTTVRV